MLHSHSALKKIMASSKTKTHLSVQYEFTQSAAQKKYFLKQIKLKQAEKEQHEALYAMSTIINRALYSLPALPVSKVVSDIWYEQAALLFLCSWNSKPRVLAFSG